MVSQRALERTFQSTRCCRNLNFVLAHRLRCPLIR
jgi:hypothetical protein